MSLEPDLDSSAASASFLLVRLGALGDIVHAIPVVAALRAAYPDARIGWIVHPRFAPLLHLVEGLDHVYPLERRSGAQAIRDVRRDRYDVCLDLQGLIKSAAVARFSGARRVIGFARPLLRESAAALAYTESGGQGSGHVIDKNLSLLDLLGVHTRTRRFALRIPPTPVVPCTREILGTGPDARFALLNPGAAWPNKRWPADRFGAVARQLWERQGLRSAVLWGPDEATLAAAVARESAGAARMAPQTTMVEMLALAQAASVLVSGRHGPTASRCSGGYTGRRPLWSHAAGAQWPMGSVGPGGLELRVVRLRLQAAVYGPDMVPGAADRRRRDGGRAVPPGGGVTGTGQANASPRAGLARWRVPLGFAAAMLVLWLARPTRHSLQIGLPLAVLGQALRIWAAGHLEKSREVTASGPYRFTRHPLYLGSSLMGLGLAVAANHRAVGLLIGLYLGLTLLLAIRTEEAYLRARFGDAYDRYAMGTFSESSRRFSLARAHPEQGVPCACRTHPDQLVPALATFQELILRAQKCRRCRFRR